MYTILIELFGLTFLHTYSGLLKDICPLAGNSGFWVISPQLALYRRKAAQNMEAIIAACSFQSFRGEQFTVRGHSLCLQIV